MALPHGAVVGLQCEIVVFPDHLHLSRDMGFQTIWYVRPAKPQISLRIRAVWSDPLLVAWIFYECYLEFLCFKEGCTGSSESTLVKMPHCWKSHVTAHLLLDLLLVWNPCGWSYERVAIIYWGHGSLGFFVHFLRSNLEFKSIWRYTAVANLCVPFQSIININKYTYTSSYYM